MKSSFLLQYCYFSFCIILSCPGHALELSQINNEDQRSLSPLQMLGQKIFFDTNLSSPAGQACASCHDPKTAYSDPDYSAPVSKGAVLGHNGSRNTPTIMYSTFSPEFHFNSQESLFIGGQFWDGRATNLQEQAQKPFLNKDEMNNRDAKEVIDKIRDSSYANFFKQLYGELALDNPEQAFILAAKAIQAFEESKVFNRFSSKYDYYLAGKVNLTPEEKRGLELFNDERKGNCASCHPSESVNGTPPLLTDFSYDNLGVPANQAILNSKGSNFVDLGLGTPTNQISQNGKFKVPSLRNIAKTSPYMHNGVFNTLEEVVQFYNTRDLKNKWGPAEVEQNKNTSELGNLNLSENEVSAIVAFLKTLTDGYNPRLPTYSLITQILELPEVRIENPPYLSHTISAVLQKTDDPNHAYFRMIQWQPNANDSTLDPVSYPSFSNANEFLEIPVVRVFNQTDFIAQLKRIKDDNNFTFELIYFKPLP